MRWKTAGIAWDRTRAFPIENANEGYIRINLQGREPEGTVQPGEDYHASVRYAGRDCAHPGQSGRRSSRRHTRFTRRTRSLPRPMP